MVFIIKKILITAVSSFLILGLSSMSTVQIFNTEVNQEVQANTIPPNPQDMLDPPTDGGTAWNGPTNVNSPSSSSNSSIDTATTTLAANTIATIAGVGLGGNLVIGIAGILVDSNTDTVYYDQYNYLSNNTTGSPSVQTATVTYFYTESTKEAQYYAGRTISYGTMIESVEQ